MHETKIVSDVPFAAVPLDQLQGVDADFFKVLHSVVVSGLWAKLGSAGQRVYIPLCHLYAYARYKPFQASYKQIAAISGCTPRHVQRGIDECVQSDLLRCRNTGVKKTVNGRPRYSENLYEITVPAEIIENSRRTDSSIPYGQIRLYPMDNAVDTVTTKSSKGLGQKRPEPYDESVLVSKKPKNEGSLPGPAAALVLEGFEAEQAERFYAKWGDQYIQDMIENADYKETNGGFKESRLAYLRSAMKSQEPYKLLDGVKRLRKGREKQATAPNRIKELEDVKSQQQIVDEWFSNLTEAQVEEIRRQMVAEANDFMKPRPSRADTNLPGVRLLFYNHANKTTV